MNATSRRTDATESSPVEALVTPSAIEEAVYHLCALTEGLTHAIDAADSDPCGVNFSALSRLMDMQTAALSPLLQLADDLRRARELKQPLVQFLPDTPTEFRGRFDAMTGGR